MIKSHSKKDHSRSKITTEHAHMRLAALWDIFWDALNNYRKNGDVNQAAAIALYAILSIIPLIILSLIAAGQFFTSNPEIQGRIIEWLQDFHPSFSGDAMKQLWQIDTKVQVLGWVGIIGLIWLSSAIFSTIETALNITFRSPSERNYLFSKLLAIAMIPLWWAIGIASVVITYIEKLVANIPFLGREGFFLINLAQSAVFRYLLPYLMVVVFFTIVYKFIPEKKVTWMEAVAGSALFAALMELAKHFFAWYIANYTRYDIIFGSLAAVVIPVLWVFYVALILLFCAELISSYQRRDLILLERALLKPKKDMLKVDERLFRKFGRIYEKGEDVFQEGDTNLEMYYILVGQIRLEKKAGRVKKVLARLGPGQYFGEMAALIGQPRTATAHVIEQSSIAVLSGDTFTNLLRQNEAVTLFMLREFSHRIIHTNASLEESTQSLIKLMIVFFFFREWPLPEDRKPLDELAQYTGKTKGEILEILRELSSQEILTLEADRITGFSREQAWRLWAEMGDRK
ncbi:MAG: YihY family inner membrane protein [Deltaproteobacteria bacterium]|nr:YihY family inner membrane protein [Deltaproteobacteria bacterium]